MQLDRYLQLARVEEATAASALAGFSAKLIRSPHHCQSLTHDQGKELTRHKDLTARTGVAVYFCDSHSPGTCEHSNGCCVAVDEKGRRRRASAEKFLTSEGEDD